ncbi:MAG: hypothetical protein GF331_15320 [Chitinivibrionales bacterium]|nr:hypothetical protein [Chitinivibrionales bacterium]
MPLTYQIELENRRITVVADGEVDLTNDGRDLIARIPRDKDYQPSYDIFVDFVNAVCNPTPADIRQLLRWLPALRMPHTNKVAVLTSNSFHYGMARMASILAGSKNISLYVFLHRQDVHAWLDSPSSGPPEGDQLSA